MRCANSRSQTRKRKKLISLPFYQRVSTHSKQIILIKLRSEKSARGSVIRNCAEKHLHWLCWRLTIKKRNFKIASHSSELESNGIIEWKNLSRVAWNSQQSCDIEFIPGHSIWNMDFLNFRQNFQLNPKLINGQLWSLIVSLIRMMCKL